MNYNKNYKSNKKAKTILKCFFYVKKGYIVDKY